LWNCAPSSPSVRPENRPKIKALLTKHGVNKLTELPEDQYETLKREVGHCE
jgi:hypothetical protein